MVDAIPSYHDLVRNDVFPLVPERAGRLLDVGGGIGVTGVALKDEGRASEVVLVDQLSGGWVDGVDRAFTVDLESMPELDRVVAENGPFDTILCLDVLEHLRDPWRVVAHLHRGLAPDGVLVISLPNVNHVSLLVPLLLRGRFDLKDAGVMDRTHLRWFARHGAIDLATCSGLVLEAIQCNVAGRRYRLLDKLTFGLLNRFVTVQYVIRVRRAS